MPTHKAPRGRSSRARKTIAGVLGFVLVAGAGAAVAAILSAGKIKGEIRGTAFAATWDATPAVAPTAARGELNETTGVLTNGAMILGASVPVIGGDNSLALATGANSVELLTGETLQVAANLYAAGPRAGYIAGLQATGLPAGVKLLLKPSQCGLVVGPGLTGTQRIDINVSALAGVPASVTLPADTAVILKPLKAGSAKTAGQIAVAADTFDGTAPTCTPITGA